MQLVSRARRTWERPARCGLGKCRLCSCVAFRGRGDVCEDCGHHYGDHTTKPFRAGVTGLPQHAGRAPQADEGGMDR
jgi:hypothetical protein